MLNCLSGKRFLGKVLAVVCSIAILLPNTAYAATVTTWTNLVSDIAVTGASNTTTLTDNIEADTTDSLGAQGATALTITSDAAQETRAIVGDGYNTQGITVSAGQTLTLNNIVLNNLKDYAVDNQGSLILQGTSSVANSNIIDSQATKTGQLTVGDGVNLNMLEHTISQSTLINNGNLTVTLDNLSVDNDITNNGNIYVNGGTTEGARQTLNNNITGTGMVFFGPRGVENNYTEIAEGKEISANVQVYGLGTYYTSNVINNGTISGATDVRSGGILTSNLSNLTGSAINNFGTINATGGTLGNAITDVNHTGTLNIQGNVTNGGYNIQQNKINIEENQSLQTNASNLNINESIYNAGTLELTGGTNTATVEGLTVNTEVVKGTVKISGDTVNNADMDIAGLQNTGAVTLTNNADIVQTDNLNITTSGLQINGTGSIDVDGLTVGSNATLTQTGGITTHGMVQNAGTITGDMTLLYHGYGNNEFYQYGTVDGNVTLDSTYNSYLFMENGSSITGQIINNGGVVVATEGSGTLNITGGITRTEEGRGNFYVGYNHFDYGTVNIQSAVEKQNITVGYYNNPTLQNTLNVTDENALIDDSSITVNAGQILNANASKITNSTIANNGNLNFNGGTNANAITGTGTLGISGTVVNNAIINQASLTLADEANFTSYEDITLSNSADITNSGSFALNGANLDIGTANIINNGTMSMDGSSYLTAGNLTNNAGHYLTIRNPNSLNLSGTFTNGGDVFLQGTLPEGFAITRTGNGKINVASGGTNSLTINNGVDLGNHSIVTYGSTSLYVNADNFGNTITGGGLTYLRSSTFTGDIQLEDGYLYFDSDDIVNLEGANISNSGMGGIFLNAGTTLNVSADSHIRGLVTNPGIINLSGEFGGGSGESVIYGNGVVNIPSGANAYIRNNVNNTVNVAQNATLNVENPSIMGVTFGNMNINGTLGLTLTEINPDSSGFAGTTLFADTLTLGENAALSLTVTDPDALERGQQTGELNLIYATYADDRDFANMFANNMYSVLPGTTLGKYIIAKLKTPEQIVEENGGTKNNVETGNSWDAVNKAELNAKAQDVYNELFGLEQHDAKGYIEKLNQIAPQGTQAILAATQGLNNLIGANVAARVAQIGKGKAGGDFFTEGSVWLEALYSHANRSGDGEFSGNTYGANFGIDGKVTDTTTLGFGYAFNSTKLDANTHDLNANGHTLFTYALYQPSQWYLRGLLNYGFAKYDDKNSTNSTDYNVQNIGVQIAGGYQIDEHWTPEAALRYTHLMTDDYTDLLGQKVKNDDNDVLTLVLGAKYETDIKTRNGFRWTPQAHLNLTYDIVSDDGKATVVLADQTYQINSKKLDAFGIEAGVGAEMGITDRIGLNLSYDFTLKGKFTNHTGALKGVYHF